MFPIEEGRSVSDEGLELDAEIAVITVVDLTFDFRIGVLLRWLERVDHHVD